jgi:hypothetical protein
VRAAPPRGVKKPRTLPEPPPATFFIDRSLGSTTVAVALREAGEAVEVHDDHFDPATEDAEWIRAVGERGWVVLTKDSAIGSRFIEVVAVRSAGIAMFTLSKAGMDGPTMAQAFVSARFAMRRLVAHHERPFIAKVHSDGKVQLWRTASALFAWTTPRTQR